MALESLNFFNPWGKFGAEALARNGAEFYERLARLTRSAPVRRLCERLAPAAKVGGQVRVLLTACRPGDGCSTLAGALALDLSQRLKLHTLLVDAHVSHPGLHRLFPSPENSVFELLPEAQGLVRPTTFPRLRLMSTWRPGTDSTPHSFEAFETILAASPIVIADLGVLRLDARTLALARDRDPVLIVARHGHTELPEIVDTVLALRCVNRFVGGLIFNGARDPLPHLIRRFLQLGRLG